MRLTTLGASQRAAKLFSFIKAVARAWALAKVMAPLTLVVRSELTDEQAAERMRSVVKAHRRGARLAAQYVSDVLVRDGGYLADRADRVLSAAISDTAPTSIRSDIVSLYESERELCVRPLEAAFKSLASVIPELEGVKEKAAMQGFREPARPNQFRVVVLAEWRDAAAKLVGPGSTQTDPLLRSVAALNVVVTYLDWVGGDTHVTNPQQPMWSWDGEGEAQVAHGMWQRLQPWGSR